jgi:riboflavin transporter FmnP
MRERVVNLSMTKSVALMASMAALGNVLAFISMYVGSFHPQVALDFSHLATAIVAVYLGPAMGMFTGALVGLAPYYYFGVLGWLGPFLGFIGFFLGKALSGLFFGLLARRMRPLSAIILGFIPECLWIYIVLRLLTQLLLPAQISSGFTDAVIVLVLAKAWVEIVIIGVVVDLVKKRRIVDAILAPTTST